MRIETERWLRQAEEDLVTARVTLAGERWSATSFSAQQAVEKGLKALLARGGGPPRIHDLVILSRRAAAPREFQRDLTELTRVYVTTRYPGVVVEPGPSAGVDQAMAERHVRLAEEVLEWVRKQL